MGALFVTGTGTEVGKTVVTAAVAALAGAGVAVLKPGQTGVGPEEPGDAAEVLRLAGAHVTVGELARYPEPLAPDTAARRSGRKGVSPAEVAEAVADLTARHPLVLVEGAGGLLVRYDEDGHTFADLALATAAAGVQVEVLLVATAGLGTLNTTALTAEALRARGLPLRGVVIGAWPDDPGLASRCNLADLPSVAGAPLLGALPERAAADGAPAFAELARTALSPALGGSWDAEAFRTRFAPPPPPAA